MSEFEQRPHLEPAPGELDELLNRLADDPNSAISEELRELLIARRLLGGAE